MLPGVCLDFRVRFHVLVLKLININLHPLVVWLAITVIRNGGRGKKRVTLIFVFYMRMFVKRKNSLKTLWISLRAGTSTDLFTFIFLNRMFWVLSYYKDAKPQTDSSIKYTLLTKHAKFR